MPSIGDKEKWFDRVRKKKRLVVMDLATFSEKKSWQLSPLNVFTIVASILLVVIVLTYCVIAYSPLKQMLPGFSDSSNREEVEAMAQIMREKEVEIALQEKQLLSVKAILDGEIPGDTSQYSIDTLNIVEQELNDNRSLEDSMLRMQMEEEYLNSDRSMQFGHEGDLTGELFYFTPIAGEISQSFVIEKGHFGVDVVAPEKSGIKSTLDGTVIFASWTSDAGHVIQVQHAFNLISVYKHNSILLKEVGDRVSAGEPIAIIGNSGKYSSGSHLHFELWQHGKPLNPQLYINF